MNLSLTQLTISPCPPLIRDGNFVTFSMRIRTHHHLLLLCFACTPYRRFPSMAAAFAEHVRYYDVLLQVVTIAV